MRPLESGWGNQQNHSAEHFSSAFSRFGGAPAAPENLSFLNSEYCRRRLEARAAGLSFPPYRAMQSRLRRALVEVAAGGPAGDRRAGVRRRTGPAIGPCGGPCGAADLRGWPMLRAQAVKPAAHTIGNGDNPEI
jgi:hypothetical protein